MKTYKCDFCGNEESLSQATKSGEYWLCGSCQWAGVDAEQIERLNNAALRRRRNEAEAQAQVGLWIGK